MSKVLNTEARLIRNWWEKKINLAMRPHNGRRLREIEIDGSEFQWWLINGNVMIIHLYGEGGFSHYMPGGAKMVDFESDIKRLASSADPHRNNHPEITQ